MGRRRTTYKPFWENIQVLANGCWLWTGSIQSEGYGRWRSCFTQHYAHVFAYESYYDTCVPRGYDVHHMCRTRRCICPLHTDKVPHANHPDGGQVVGRNKTFCRNGHELTASNTCRYGKTKYRSCRRCRRKAYKQHKERTLNASNQP